MDIIECLQSYCAPDLVHYKIAPYLWDPDQELLRAAHRGQTQWAQFLLKLVNLKFNDLQSTLKIASKQGHLDIVQMLYPLCPVEFQRNYLGDRCERAAQRALVAKSLSNFSYDMAAGRCKRPELNWGIVFRWASFKGHLDLLKWLLKEHAPKRASQNVDPLGLTLKWAAFGKSSNVIDFLLCSEFQDKGLFDIGEALNIAAWIGDPTMIHLLVEHATQGEKQKALAYAKAKGNLDCIEMLCLRSAKLTCGPRSPSARSLGSSSQSMPASEPKASEARRAPQEPEGLLDILCEDFHLDRLIQLD